MMKPGWMYQAVINYNYKTTYDETYQESANLRIDLAEQLSKLPLSYFSKHNLSDLAQTIMADVASIEHAFANAVANFIGFSIYFLVISAALLIMNWKLLYLFQTCGYESVCSTQNTNG